MDRDNPPLSGTCRYTNLMSVRSRSDIIECDDDLVIKLYSSNVRKEEVENEVFFTDLARSHGLRVPRITGLLEDGGRWGYAYHRISGPTLLHWAVMEMGEVFDEVPLALATIHYEIHGHRDSRLPSIKQRLRSTIRAGEHVEGRLRSYALSALEDLPEGTCICHGDFHPENVIMSENGPIVLDWVDAASGDHMADAARSYLLLDVWLPTKVSEQRLELSPSKLRSLCQGYRRTYLALSGGQDDRFNQWLLPVSVARLCQDAPGESDRLKNIIETLI